MADEVFQRLKFSYDRLPNAKLKQCFLYCALYPEDFEISKEELIEYWIVEGLVEEIETRKEMYDEGLSILKRLENNCLLESVKKDGCVKMHDLVRDLALHITSSESPRYLVKAGMLLEELPNEQEWKEDVEKVSLMENRIKEISSDETIPKCKALKTLLLRNNPFLERIHESFFTLMTGLTILDLSGNRIIKALPNSVSELQNLNALLLHNCGELKYVPSLSKIRGLKKLETLEIRFVNLEDYRLYLSRLQRGCPNRLFSCWRIYLCPKIEKLFWPELVHNLKNLEKIHVSTCEQLVEIISTSDDDEENKEEGKDFTVFTLPKLREMTFRKLRQLKCICNRGSLMECNSLEKIEIDHCPKLKRIPLLLHQPDNGQLLPPVSLKRIEISSSEWWDSLEWDHLNIKNVLEPYVIH